MDRINNIIILMYVFLIIVLVSCEQINEPTYHISAIDIDPPIITIHEPKNNESITGYFNLNFSVDELFGIKKIRILIDSNYNLRTEQISSSNNTFSYVVDGILFEGIHSLFVEVTDASDNISYSKLSNLSFTPVIELIDGLSSPFGRDEIRDIKEDDYGNIWFAARYGLYKYSATKYTKHPEGFNLDIGSVSLLAIDNQNKVWMKYSKLYSGETKLVCYNGFSVESTHYMPRGSNSSYIIKSFSFDSQDSLWGIFDSNGYFSFKDSIWNLRYTYPEKCYSFIVDNFDRKWMYSTNGIRYLLENEWYETNFPFNLNGYFFNDHSKNIWFCNSSQLYKFSGDHWDEFIFKESLEGIRAVTIDVENYIWIGSESYIYKYDLQGNKLKEYKLYDYIDILFSDSQNNIWIGNDSGLYLLKQIAD